MKTDASEMRPTKGLSSTIKWGEIQEAFAALSDKSAPTPRTDALWKPRPGFGADPGIIEIVPNTEAFNLARQLERELVAMTGHADLWMKTCRKLEDEHEQSFATRDMVLVPVEPPASIPAQGYDEELFQYCRDDDYQGLYRAFIKRASTNKT